MRFLFLFIILILLFSCNQSHKTGQKSEVIENRFIGLWKYYAINPPGNPNDHTMDAVICDLEKYKNTKETYVFHLSFAGKDLILSVEDENNLKGINAAMNIRYEKNTGHLILTTASNNEIIFSKLK